MGSHVADALTNAGYETVVFDKKRSQYLRPDQTMIVGDLADAAAVDAALHNVNFVFHFGAIADIQDCADDPVAAARVNVLGTVTMLESARRHGVERFVFSSSAYIYSRHGGFYRASKQGAEAFVSSFSEAGGPPFTIIRFGSLYGRRAGPMNRIHRMIGEALKSGSISFPGHGDAMREFIHVADAAKLCVNVLDPRYANKHVLATGFERFRVKDVALMIKEILARDIQIEFAEGEPPGHYLMTPFTFRPEMAEKMMVTDFVEFGHGLLDCIQEQYDAVQERADIQLLATGEA